MPYKVKAYGISDIGLVRQNNEDAWGKLPELNFYALADGMGGHRAGEVAAKEAIKALCDHFKQTVSIAGPKLSLDEAYGLVQLSIEHANSTVYQLSKSDPELSGMGTTLCCIYCHPKGIIYAHVGDSRIYHLHNGTLAQVTKDHSLLRELVDLGQLDEKNSGDFLYKNIITKAIGTENLVEPTVQISEIVEDDIFLMCTDGLSDLLTLNEMEYILKESSDIEYSSKKLITKAIERGGYDNITVVVVRVDEVS